MKRWTYPAVLIFALISFSGCGASHKEVSVQPTSFINTDTRFRVVDVSNNTGKLFDVDVIGLLWNSLDASLYKRGLLWTPESPLRPLKIEAQVMEYQKGCVWYRCILPMWGNTVLAVKCTVKQGDQVIATVESKEAFTPGNGGFTMDAWKRVFSRVGEDIVNQLIQKKTLEKVS